MQEAAPRYEIRAATLADEDLLFELSRFLDSVNLPHEREALRRNLSASERSFRGEIEDPRHREYIFLVHDRETNRAVGTSLIIGQLGRPGAPYIYSEVRTEERYSAYLDRLLKHRVLVLGQTFDGPTEIGGLVVHPDYRRVPEKLGMLISYVRFVFMAIHRPAFQDQVLAELMPPLAPDGTSPLWNAVGEPLTGLTYREANLLTKKNKEFVMSLFPTSPIYVPLLPKEAQEVVCAVGPETRGVEKLLGRIGFRNWNRIDPFDGGPHFVANLDDVTLVRAVRRLTLESGEFEVRPHRALVVTDLPTAPHFRAIAVPAELHADTVRVSEASRAVLDVAAGSEVAVLPLP